MEEVELEKGLKEETKKENRQLRDDLEKEVKAKEELRAQLTADLAKAEERLTAIQNDVTSITSRNKELETLKTDLETKYSDLQKKLSQLQAAPTPAPATPAPAQPQAAAPATPVALEKIVVNPAAKKGGKVISVDKEASFVIVSLGEKDGVKKGAVLSISRGDKVLGDVKVSRVLPEMSAADFVAPLKADAVKKDDQVVMKQ